ncbi:1-acyl-sn-glycerol-3-phosphate acyltransferases [Mesonia phycicola]|uniref:1-acyl-sn-glycerol-3-phosphate acyltransferases n=2 Tax=Mesonia phycicola TaxID=579105 RepID=A0A1M6A7Y6_9FLAO|nr:1-acyl-sn-glycerol-3-phosphate acyltransferases [Mesonia phycicola]
MVKYIFHNLMNWKIEGQFDASIKKSVIIVVPHTSWHDFYLGVFTRRIVKLPMNFVGKKELFRWPFGAYFKWMGGTPLDRTGNQNKVEAIAKIFEDKEEFRLALAPEGTRKKVLQWKSGFYYIALLAKVPIIPVAFDYGRRVIKIGEAFYPTGNYEKDSKLLQLFYKDVKGKTDL